MAYVVSLKQFDGPLDLLLTLIGRAKIDIRDIFISEITEQYLDTMSQIGELNMDAASEFLQMAATLIEIKSRAMLPAIPKEAEEGEETPEQALIRQLTEYRAFKEASADMRKLEDQARRVFSKLPEEFPLPPPEFELTGLSLDKLKAAFMRVLSRARDDEGESPEREREIKRDVYTVQSCMFRIQSRLKGGDVKFEELFEERPTRSEVVAVFVALLELLKLNRLAIRQRRAYGDIMIQARR